MFELIKPTSGIVHRHAALFDVHVPHHIELAGILKFIQEYKPTEFVLGGDFMNLEWASHWNEKEFAHIGFEKLSKMLQQEFEAGRKVLRDIASALPKDCKKYYIPGNHEDWLYSACLEYPGLAGPVDLGVDRMVYTSDLARIRKQVLAELLAKHLETDKVGFDVLPFGKELVLGKLTYIHGHQVGSLTAMKRKFPARNVVCGHHHTHLVDTLHNSGDARRANQYVMVPCLCHLAPGYLNDSSTRWLNGFWIADVLGNGLFDGKVIKVIDGKVLYGGNVYK
jgi:hypothetical protein